MLWFIQGPWGMKRVLSEEDQGAGERKRHIREETTKKTAASMVPISMELANTRPPADSD